MPHMLPFWRLGWQIPAAQKLVAVHLESSPMQSPLHCVAAHTKLPQLTVCRAGHAPAPLQPAGRVAMFVLALQLAARHDLAESG
jgi:hypothetical protein